MLKPVKYWHHQCSGSVAVEGAMVIGLMVFIIAGMIELTLFFHTNKQLQQASEHTAQHLASISQWYDGGHYYCSEKGEIYQALRTAEFELLPYGAKILARFCDKEHDSKLLSLDFPHKRMKHQQPVCGMGQFSEAVEPPTIQIDCNLKDGKGLSRGRTSNITGQKAVVSVGCNYFPFFSVAGLLTDGIWLEQRAEAPMQKPFYWNLQDTPTCTFR